MAKLELRTFDIESVSFGDRTALTGRTLMASKEEIGRASCRERVYGPV